jgi:uncharacterized membrane protein
MQRNSRCTVTVSIPCVPRVLAMLEADWLAFKQLRNRFGVVVALLVGVDT